MNTLDTAKRALEAAQKAIRDLCLTVQDRCTVPLSQSERQTIAARYSLELTHVNTETQIAAWHSLYYGEQPKQARKHVAKLAQTHPEIAGLLSPLVETMLSRLADVETARTADKAEKAARKAEREHKAATVKRLGVNLKAKGGAGATEATYLALRETFAPIQARLEDTMRAHYVKRFEGWRDRLAANQWNGGKVFPYRDRKGKADETHVVSPHPHFWRCFAHAPRGGEGVAAFLLIREDVQTYLASEAKRDAESNVAGFCAKMAGKIADAIAEENPGAAMVSARAVAHSADTWQDTDLTVTLDRGAAQLWHTQVILNFSVLGKAFNQWPTRRVS